MTHPHAPPEPSSQDGPFLRTLGVTAGLLLGATAALVIMVDPLGRFGTGLVPPVVTQDRDRKPALLDALPEPPGLVVLGSSRSKTLAPACLGRLAGRPAFNFAVDGAGPDDLRAILHYLLDHHPGSLTRLVVGVDPEMLEARALWASRVLAPYAVTGGRRSQPSVWADLFGLQPVTATIRALFRLARPDTTTPAMMLEPDGRQRYPLWERQLAAGTAPVEARVEESIPGILSQYPGFTRLDSSGVATLRGLFEDAHRTGLLVTAFIPPVHPALLRALPENGRARSDETAALLRRFEAGGLLRYVETRELGSVGDDSTRYVDAVHFIGPAADRLAEILLNQPGGCALQ
jgi:hypothetical protein